MTNEAIKEHLDKQEIPYKLLGDMIEINVNDITEAQYEFIDKLVEDE